MTWMNFFKKRRNPLKELKRLLDGFELPSFPKAALKILQTLRDPQATASEIAKKIEADPGIHISVLKTVNSAAFGLPRRVVSVEHAVALLGRARLESLILPLAVRDSLPPVNVSCLDMKKFWLAACRRASLARRLAKKMHPSSHMESFTAGLLQDIGIAVMAFVKEKSYCPTLETWNKEKNKLLPEMEKETLGFDHQLVGSLMAEQWNLPIYLVQTIGNHHLFKEGIDPAIYLVSHIRYCQNGDIENSLEDLFEAAQKYFGLSSKALWQMVEGAFLDAEELTTIFQ